MDYSVKKKRGRQSGEKRLLNCLMTFHNLERKIMYLLKKWVIVLTLEGGMRTSAQNPEKKSQKVKNEKKQFFFEMPISHI